MSYLFRFFCSLFCIFLFFVDSLQARSVYLNKVKIDGVFNQKIEHCAVEIDAQGDVWIDAPAYQVRSADPSLSKPIDPVLQKRYWLVVERSLPEPAPYDIEIFIRDQLVKKLSAHDNDKQTYLEVSNWLKPGENQIYLIAKKQKDKPDKSHNSITFTKVLLGEGKVLGQNIIIEQPLLVYKRSSLDDKDYSDKMMIVAK